MNKKTINFFSRHLFISAIKNNFSALKHKNFRIFWFGQIISLIGTWMQTIGLPWLTYTLTDSPLLLGLVSAVQFTPMLLFCLFAGVVIDNFDKKKIVITTQITLAFLAFILFLLVFFGLVQYWHLIIIALLIGCANSLDMPARQSYIIEMVGREDLMNAIALNSAVFNSARIIGPAIAALLMGLLGVAYCFLINAISFLPLIAGLFFIKPVIINNYNKVRSSLFKDLADGLKYILNQKILLWTLLGVVVVGTFGMNYNVLVPVFAKTVLNKGETGFGLLMTFMGFGSFFGAMAIASRSKRGPKTIIMLFTAYFSSLVFILIGFNSSFNITALLLSLVGFSNVVFFTTANSILQLNAKYEFRGRVISVYTLLFGGSSPFGSLFAGVISDRFNASYGFIACGMGLFIFITMLFLINRLTFKKDNKL
ncbi:MAG: MFS transporter [Spirochaetes bacterium]|nr:MFS transporter [Spirochaetota bacterium]